MGATALLLSRDEKVQRALCALLGEMRIEVEVETDVLKAVQLLHERKFEALLIDCEMQGAGTVLKDIASYLSNRTAVPFAIVPEVDVPKGLPQGAKFIISKPVSAEQARGTIEAASALLIGEYRRYFRCALEVPVRLFGRRTFPERQNHEYQHGGIGDSDAGGDTAR